MTGAVPLIDFASFLSGGVDERERVACRIGEACEEIGFFMLSGHGVPQALVDELVAVSYRYFALPEDEKRRLTMPADRYRGYIPLRGDNAAASLDDGSLSLPDLKESFSIGPFDLPDDSYCRDPAAGTFFAPNMWPARPEAWRSLWEAYYRHMERLAPEIMRSLAVALDQPEDYFASRIDRHITNASIIHYPPQPTPPAEGEARAGAHSDLGSLTIIYSDTDVGGIEVLTREGVWFRVPRVPGALTVNLGDLMAEWTNDRWVSTSHRVVNPPPEQSDRARLSLCFFHQPNYDARIECIPSCQGPGNPPRYGATTSGAYIKRKLDLTREAPILG